MARGGVAASLCGHRLPGTEVATVRQEMGTVLDHEVHRATEDLVQENW